VDRLGTQLEHGQGRPGIQDLALIRRGRAVAPQIDTENKIVKSYMFPLNTYGMMHEG
jgi:hypothetical protein